MAAPSSRPTISQRPTSLKGENGLTFTPDDRASLASAMLRYAENAGLRKRHGEKSLHVSQNQLSWANLARDSLRVYEDLLTEFLWRTTVG